MNKVFIIIVGILVVINLHLALIESEMLDNSTQQPAYEQVVVIDYQASLGDGWDAGIYKAVASAGIKDYDLRASREACERLNGESFMREGKVYKIVVVKEVKKK